jgi:hypothetical protein
VRIFLSYRRGDAGGYAGRLTDALQQRLGPRSVFQDVTAIGPGQDYTAAIDHALRDSDVVLAVIGGGWRPPRGTQLGLDGPAGSPGKPPSGRHASAATTARSLSCHTTVGRSPASRSQPS